ncbi:MAG: type IV secretory system conjugative DNA transfer family protein [Candidatus Saccharimonadales bacterium]
MTNLEPNESVHIQLVIAPVRLREALILARRVLGNEDMLNRLNTRNIPLWSLLTSGVNRVIFGVLELIGDVTSGGTSYTKRSNSSSERAQYERIQVAKREKPARTLSTFEQELMETMHNKLNQPLFRVNVRAAVKLNSGEAVKRRLTAIKTSLHAYSVPSYQALKARLQTPVMKQLNVRAFTSRMPAFLKHRTMVLSASELASLYHFPLGKTAQTDNLVTSLSRTLAAPISLKQNRELDVILGENLHHGTVTPVGLTAQERERHLYIIGGTGNGKTTMLQYQIVQDMQQGKGIAVVDPHGDMAETLLRHVPPERVKDVIYFNPDDLEYPIGLNLLELTPGLKDNELLREKDIITESAISVFRKIFSDDDSGGHRIEYVLRNTVQTALTTENPTLFTVFDLLNDTKYRKSIVRTLEDKNLKNFWKNELGKAGDMQKVKMAAGITAKIGRFLFSASAKQILEQPTSTIDFDDIINDGKILICNLSKGLIGEDTSELFGITVLAKLQLASLRRARITQAERRPFYLYVDEFQNFATASFVQMLSEARKYRLFLTMAEQSTSQQDDQQLVQIILANVGTVITFRSGNPQDEYLLLPLFKPYIDEGEISNLPAYNFYAKLSAVKPQEPLSGQTLQMVAKI